MSGWDMQGTPLSGKSASEVTRTELSPPQRESLRRRSGCCRPEERFDTFSEAGSLVQRLEHVTAWLTGIVPPNALQRLGCLVVGHRF